jgi:hypothetical protein
MSKKQQQISLDRFFTKRKAENIEVKSPLKFVKDPDISVEQQNVTFNNDSENTKETPFISEEANKSVENDTKGVADQISIAESYQDIDACDYEKLRIENIKRNAEFLASLGLENLKPKILMNETKSKAPNTKKTKRKESDQILPLRRY